MELGMIGLGRMGFNMARRLIVGGHRVVGYDRAAAQVEALRGEGGGGAASVEELVGQLGAPRVLWLMIPSGAPTRQQIEALAPLLAPGDIVVDGGNSNYRDSIQHAAVLKERGIRFMDVGVSGGIWGFQEGFCLMAGGDNAPLKRLRPICEALAPPDGYAHVGSSGAGHFTKMVHNGIEYGMMQAYAEGFELMYHSEFDLDLSEIAGIWRYGSVVRSWLLELLHAAMEQHGDKLDDIAPYVEDSGEGRWTINEAINENVPVPVISAALYARFASRQEINFSAKVAAALRNQFGGHAVKAVKDAKAGSDPR
jgi:6-phosphogluconate dehydrogenase